jgi:hypothetical protein
MAVIPADPDQSSMGWLRARLDRGFEVLIDVEE